MQGKIWRHRFHLAQRRRGMLLGALGFAAILSASFFATDFIPTFAAGIATLLSAVAYFSSRHHQELDIFRALFKEFNERYDKLNERLNEIRLRPPGEQLKAEKGADNKTDKDVLCDYFNLCAEQYMYETAGYLDERAWKAWRKGMKYFAADCEIRTFWEQELQEQEDSYYGFSLEVLAEK